MQAYQAWALQREDEDEPAPAGVAAGKRTLTGRLPARLAARASARLGQDISNVTVLEDGAAEELGARAFARGEALHFASGAFRPDTADGVRLIGHELAHVAQQRAGRVAADARVAEVPVNTDVGLEREADALGAELAAAFDLDAFSAFGQPQRGGATAAPTSATAVAQGFGLGLPWPIGCAPGGSTSPATDADALARWRRGYDRFTRLYHAGLAHVPPANETTPTRATLFRNACQWIDAGEVQLVLMAKASATRQSGKDDLYFGDGNFYPATNPDPTQVSAGGAFRYAVTWGVCDGSTMWLIDLMDPAWTDDLIKDTLIHEIQHDADQGPGGEFSQDPAAVENYQSEFRARWIEPNATADYGDPSQPAKAGVEIEWPKRSGNKRAIDHLANERQQGILKKLVDIGGGYNYIGRLYFKRPAFRHMVDQFTVASGGNLVDSVRVQALTELIVTRSPTDTILTSALTTLDSIDLAFLADRTAAADFWATAGRNLAAPALTQLSAAIDRPGQFQVHTVVAGDSLSGIAGQLLGDETRWPEIYNAPGSQAVVGPDPNRIEPGMVLLVPAQ